MSTTTTEREALAVASEVAAKGAAVVAELASAQRRLLSLIADCAAVMEAAADHVERGHHDLAIENLKGSAAALGCMVTPTGAVAH